MSLPQKSPAAVSARPVGPGGGTHTSFTAQMRQGRRDRCHAGKGVRSVPPKSCTTAVAPWAHWHFLIRGWWWWCCRVRASLSRRLRASPAALAGMGGRPALGPVSRGPCPGRARRHGPGVWADGPVAWLTGLVLPILTLARPKYDVGIGQLGPICITIISSFVSGGVS